jgi:hypothetical protein
MRVTLNLNRHIVCLPFSGSPVKIDIYSLLDESFTILHAKVRK